jgi:ketosteroid isomerase-like protein
MNPTPGVIERYFAFENAGDAASLAACFTDDGAVKDEGQIYRGPAAIARWSRDAKAKYGHRVDPLRTEVDGERTRVTATVTGTFPGSPIDLAHDFHLKDGRIAMLEIHP